MSITLSNLEAHDMLVEGYDAYAYKKLYPKWEKVELRAAALKRVGLVYPKWDELMSKRKEYRLLDASETKLLKQYDDLQFKYDDLPKEYKLLETSEAKLKQKKKFVLVK